jgi:hypothetical protein
MEPFEGNMSHMFFSELLAFMFLLFVTFRLPFLSLCVVYLSPRVVHTILPHLEPRSRLHAPCCSDEWRSELVSETGSFIVKQATRKKIS